MNIYTDSELNNMNKNELISCVRNLENQFVVNNELDNDLPEDSEIAYYVYKTYDYDWFKRLAGNRSTKHKDKIKRSIEQNGYFRNPININDLHEIGDGQARFYACKELNLPIEFIVSKNMDLHECIKRNSNSTNWKMKNFVDSFAEAGNEDYIVLKDLLERYNGQLADENIIILAGKSKSEGGASSGSVKAGKFKMMDTDTASRRIEYVCNMMDIIRGICGRQRPWVCAFKFVYYCNEIDKTKLEKKLKEHINMIHASNTIKESIDMLEDVYNFHRKEKVYFHPWYNKYCKICTKR